jgi:hypothetical protein
MAYICHVDPRSCAALQSVPDAAGYIEPFTASSDPHISLFAFSVLLHFHFWISLQLVSLVL